MNLAQAAIIIQSLLCCKFIHFEIWNRNQQNIEAKGETHNGLSTRLTTMCKRRIKEEAEAAEVTLSSCSAFHSLLVNLI